MRLEELEKFRLIWTMKNKPITPLIISFVVGVLYHLYRGHYKAEGDILGQSAFIVGGALAYVVAVAILPLIVSIILLAKNKVFPSRLFIKFSYFMLAFFTVFLLVGTLPLQD